MCLILLVIRVFAIKLIRYHSHHPQLQVLILLNCYSLMFGHASPVVSYDGYKYYVIFVDHFTHYIWLHHLKQKFAVHDIFIRFKALVEKYFQRPIISLYMDNGGEYI